MTHDKPLLRVFVYGSLREGMGNHFTLNREDVHATRVKRGLNGDLFSTEPCFTMLDLGSFPAVVRRGSTAIVGEVYSLPNEEAFGPLDRLEGHPNFYKREVIRLDDGSEAWIYVLVDLRRVSVNDSADDRDEVSSGDWRSYVNGDAEGGDEARATYFAYGSNLSSDQMEKRCPSAVLIGTAVLKGHRLDFAGWSQQWCGGVATVTPARNSKVPGALWSVSINDLHRLDSFEGHPTFYRRFNVTVVDDEGQRVLASTYRLTRKLMAPSEAYVGVIIRGRRDLGLTEADIVDSVARADKAERARQQRPGGPQQLSAYSDDLLWAQVTGGKWRLQ